MVLVGLFVTLTAICGLPLGCLVTCPFVGVCLLGFWFPG